MHGLHFLQDLAVVMLVAGVVTVVFHQLKQPVVLGYILAGLIIGPHTPPFPLIQDAETIRILAELGIILLMFSLGLEFSLRKLRRVGAAALIAAVLEILLMVWAGYEAGRFFGWSTMDSIFLGAMLSISSTTIILKALEELGKTKEPFSQLIFGILVIEDILGIAMIALLSGISLTGSLSAGEVGKTLGSLGIFLAVTLIVGLLTVPRLIGYVARFNRNEMLLVTVLGLCFGVSLLAVKLGYSTALGAFLIGAVIAEAREIHRIETLMGPVRDMFSAIFFVAIGLLINPKLLANYWLPVVVITLVVVGGKILTCSLGAFAGGQDTRTSLRVGMSLAQIGEFSFIIASLGITLKVTSDFLYPIAVAVSALTTFFTPYLIKSADGVVNWFDRVAPRPVLNYLQLYTTWIGQWNQTHPGLARRLVRKWSWQMALNLLLVAGVFLGASFIGRQKPDFLPDFLTRGERFNAILCLCAFVLSLPLLIATYRKLQALGLLLGDLAQKRATGGAFGSSVQVIISKTVPAIGIIGMALLVLVLSSTILPSGRSLIVLLVIVTVLTIWLWREMVRIYSKAQHALGETLAEKKDKLAKPEQAPPLGGVLKDAHVELIRIGSGSPAVGKLIHELGLRTVTGATIVALERDGQQLISPGPDEEIQAGDQLMLLGNERQVAAARALLNGAPPASPGGGQRKNIFT